MANTHDQIHYKNNISNPGGHIQKSIQFKYVVYKMGLDMQYICIWKYLIFF